MYRILSTLFITLAMTLSGILQARGEDMAIGQWYAYPIYTYPSQKVIETPELVYYLSGNSLFSYNKDTYENYSYTNSNLLNDINITNIWYNYDAHYLLVAYASGNIDLLYDDGRVVNLSDIKDTSSQPVKEITCVAFDGKNIYVATNFGIVKFNTVKYEVTESGIYNEPITALTVVNDKLLVHFPDTYIKFIKTSDSIRNKSKFIPLGQYGNGVVEMTPLSENVIATRNGTNTSAYIILIHFDYDTPRMGRVVAFNGNRNYMSYLQYGKDGSVYYTDENTLYKLHEDFTREVICQMPEDLHENLYATRDGESIWGLTRDGLIHMSVSSDGGVTSYGDRIRPEGISTQEVHYIIPSADGKSVYAHKIGPTSYRWGYSRSGLPIMQSTSKIDIADDFYEDATAYPVESKASMLKAYMNTYGKYAFAPAMLASDPDDPDTYYMATGNDGVYRVTKGELTGRYDEENAPINNVWGWIIYNVSIDRVGNLWVLCNNGDDPWLMVLPAAKRRLDPKDVKPEDWTTYDFDGVNLGLDAQVLHCKKSNMILIAAHNYEPHFIAIDTRGTFNNFADDRIFSVEKFVDQDGKEFTANSELRKTALVEDNNGHVWIGTDRGVYEISSPNNITPGSTRVTHVKVPRYDGTNAADYLLGSDVVLSMTVDPSNRKWLATEGSGLYLVSPNGNRILRHFIPENSPLPTNMVNCVYADPNGSTLFIGTNQGLFRYSSDTTPAHENYNDIYAFPNPVRHDYFGPIYIKGLKDNSLVKIADVSGNVVSQGRAEGGLYQWDGCNRYGSRVKTGVYYVFASQGGENSSGEGAVTKILVVN